MKRNVILSGGPAHEYGRTSPLLAAILAEGGIESAIHEDFAAVEGGLLRSADLLTLNCFRCTTRLTPDWLKEWNFELSEAAREEMAAFLARGGGLLALHCAPLCFDDWPEFRNVLGAWWEWGRSGHAPFGEQPMHVCRTDHPITRGLADFVIRDELYGRLRLVDRVEPLIEATWDGEAHPILWTRQYGPSRVCYDALGHHVEAFEQPESRTILRRAALWVLGEPGGR